MRVFVTGVGRCGSVSFREAARFARNYTTGHESKCGLLEYPDRHIEVSAHLWPFIVYLVAKYPDAKWVHLIRDPEPSIASISRVSHGAVMRAFATLYPSVMPSEQLGDIAFRYYWSSNDLIRAQLDRVPLAQRVEFRLETAREQWPLFWRWIGAEGDLAAGIAAWDVIRNSGRERGEI